MLEVKNLYKSFTSKEEKVNAVDNISFSVKKGEMFTLLGPSGCGKTTSLRSIAGLEVPEGGEISIAGKVVFSSGQKVFVPPHRRNMGMVFQSYAIWPHMTVFENVAFPLRVGKGKMGKQMIIEKVEKALDTVQLSGLGKRSATKLSGGQQQRLALARALVAEPEVILLDEPLSNLDAKLRQQMRVELKMLQRRLQITSVYVTHDQYEALGLSNTIAVMNQGKIVQLGSPRQIYEHPSSRFVADFIGTINWITGKVDSVTAEGLVASAPWGTLRVANAQAPHCSVGEEILLSIRPENIQVARRPEDLPGQDAMEAHVETVIYSGDYVEGYLSLGGTMLKTKVHPAVGIKSGSEAYVYFPPESLMLLFNGVQEKESNKLRSLA